jgi:hypothetical protein
LNLSQDSMCIPREFVFGDVNSCHIVNITSPYLKRIISCDGRPSTPHLCGLLEGIRQLQDAPLIPVPAYNL